jgi:hypothetical protein
MIITLPVRCGDTIHNVSIEDDLSMTLLDHDWLDETLVDLGVEKPQCLITRENWDLRIKYAKESHKKDYPCQIVLDGIFNTTEKIPVPEQIICVFAISSLERAFSVVFTEPEHKDLIRYINDIKENIIAGFNLHLANLVLFPVGDIPQGLRVTKSDQFDTHNPTSDGLMAFFKAIESGMFSDNRDYFFTGNAQFISTISKSIWGSMHSLVNYKLKNRNGSHLTSHEIKNNVCDEIMDILRQVVATTPL